MYIDYKIKGGYEVFYYISHNIDYKRKYISGPGQTNLGFRLCI